MEQALADYAQFIDWYKGEQMMNCSKCPVITFGGSYGGMLSAYLRMKYPEIVDASISSSAPILYFKGVNDPEGFYKISTLNYQRSQIANCTNLIRYSYELLTNYSKNQNLSQGIYEKFN